MSVKPLTAWSYSRYALWELCPLKFKLEVLEGKKEPPSKAMERGLAVHKALAAYIMGKGPLPDFITDAATASLYGEMRAFPNEDKVVEEQWGFTARWTPTGWFGKDTWLRASLDAGFMYDDLTFEAVDHKTGKMYDTNADQMELYALSVFLKYPAAKQTTTRLVYVDAGTQQFADFDGKDREKLIAKWESKVAPMFADAAFVPRPNDKCRFCAFSRSKGGQCRFG